jgi:hypothetical protein
MCVEAFASFSAAAAARRDKWQQFRKLNFSLPLLLL